MNEQVAVLEHADVLPYLIERGVITVADVLDDPALEIIDASRRNRNFRLRGARVAPRLLKHGVDDDRRATLAREAAVYRFLHDRPLPRAGRRPIPRLERYDAERSVILLELVAGGRSLLALHERTRRCPAPLAAATGAALAWVHTVTEPPEARAAIGATVGRRPPGALQLFCPTLPFYAEQASFGNVLVLRALQADNGFVAALEEIAGSWREACLVHGDLRFDNIVVPRNRNRHGTRVVLVDWELATVGDPAWDVGCLFGDHLALWLRSAPLDSETTPELVEERAGLPAEDMQAAAQAFWRAYVSAGGATVDRAAFLRRAVRFAAVRLVQAAIEMTRPRTDLPATAVYFLQLASNVATHPDAAAAALFGFGSDGV